MIQTKLASVPRTGEEATKPAKKGYQLRQLNNPSSVLREIRRVIGVFNPMAVTLERRLQMLLDPTVAFSQAILRAPITKSDWSITGDDAEIAAVTEHCIKEVYHEMALGASMAIPLGYQALEKVWKSGPLTVNVHDKSGGTTSKISLPNAWTYERFKALEHDRNFLLVDREKDAWAGIRGVGLDDLPKDIGTDNSMLWSFLSPLKWGSLTGDPMLDKQYGPWWEKVATNFFCDRYFEKKADGQYIAHCPAELDGPNGTKIDGFEFIQTALMGAKNGEAITLPGETDEKGNRLVDVALLQDDKRGDMYHPRLEYLDLQILRGALIADRAGSAGRGSGIGTGEAAVHFDILQMLMEEILTDWFKVVQEQVVKPFVIFNYGEQKYYESRTKIVSKGISNWMRDLFRVVLQQMTQFEVALKDGKVVRAYEYIDFVGICEQLGVPLKSADMLGSLAHARNDEALGLKPPAGNPGDTNVKGKGGDKPKGDKPPKSDK